MGRYRSQEAIPRFDRDFLGSSQTFTRIGGGGLGGKAEGLIFIREFLARGLDAARYPGLEVVIPTLTVLGTDVFDEFLQENGLAGLAASGESDEAIARAFQHGTLPVAIAGDLRALAMQVHAPLAVRSSSVLEDSLLEPFAGVYATKMTPNDQHDADARFRKLAEAVKFVWASTFFSAARDYIASTGHDPRQEKMAVIVQEVVGRRHRDRFYPDLSGVGRSWNFYPTGHATGKDGVVSLALGLGKTIVEGGRTWTFSPAWPKAAPPYNRARDLLTLTQTAFWAVRMGNPPVYDPIAEAEYLVSCDLAAAEEDETLRETASTYDPQSDRLVLGTGRQGPRVLTFAPLLQLPDRPIASLVTRLLAIAKEALGEEVEIEFAATLPPPSEGPVRFGFLQVRPMATLERMVDLDEALLANPRALVASRSVLGNGTDGTIHDVVYVCPETFEARHTPTIAEEIAGINRTLLAGKRSCVLIGFGRWGSQDQWLGIPVQWGQISSARVLVEASLPSLPVDPSQGSHFFHNLTSFRVPYFVIPPGASIGVDWGWLAAAPAVQKGAFVRHVRTDRPLEVRVDGRRGAGVVLRAGNGQAGRA